MVLSAAVLSGKAALGNDLLILACGRLNPGQGSLKKGDKVKAIIKSTEVMLLKD
jgi:hypothetical protein